MFVEITFRSGRQATVPADAQQVWRAVLEELRLRLPSPGYETWLRGSVLLDCPDGRTFIIGVPTRLARDWLIERYSPVVRETLSEITSRECQVIVTVDPTSSSVPDEPSTVLEEPAAGEISEVVDTRSTGSGAARLNPNFTFANFVVGSSNSSRFAHAACRAVAGAPGRAYNPLFLYGGVGLGKTHLMHAIGHAVRAADGSGAPRVAYVTSEKFMNEMIASIQENCTHEFRSRYRSVDVLLIDDIQFLAGKDRTQEEFFHTFNALHEVQKQIVISSDRPPKDIPTLEERLRSRFEWGLIADIQPPDLETRLAILRSKLGENRRLVPDEVCSLIALRIQKNIRELEGALIRVLAHAALDGQPVTLESATRVLRDILPEGAGAPPSVELIQQTVAAYYSVPVAEMKGRRRDRHTVLPRQVAMFLAREETASSLPVIGHAFDKDHTTVLHAYERILDLSREDVRLQADLRQIRDRLHAR
jgi:chromosomal replication initiator protein